MRKLISIWCLLATVAIAACGGDDDFNCDLDEATTLAADASWPASRRDAQNTAQIDALIDVDDPVATCIFPGDAGAPENGLADCDAGGSPISTTAIVGEINGDERLILATQDGLVHILDTDGSEIELVNEIDLGSAGNTPLLGADSSIFATTTGGLIRRFEGDDGESLITTTLVDDIEVAPILGPDGVIYAGTATGFFGGVCTNTAIRFSANLGSISAPAAVIVDPTDRDPERTIVLATADGGRVVGLDDDEGEILWTFFTSGRIQRSAVVIDTERDIFVIADGQGQIFAASFRTGLPRLDSGAALEPYRSGRCIPSGEPCSTTADCTGAETCAPETITASPALGAEHVYIATEGARSESGGLLTNGAVHAFSLDFAGGDPDWSWILPAAGIIRSSPVVATGPAGDVVVVAADLACPGEDDPCGMIAALRDGDPLWMIELPDRVGTASPSIRRVDGRAVIYIGTDGGKLYEIG